VQDLAKYFKKANLRVDVLSNPLRGSGIRGENARKVFQMTIVGTKPEVFQIYAGENNEVQVLDADPKKEQVLLFVREPKRVFTETHYDWRQGKNVTTTQETPGGIRRYLMGMDECHLFISELPTVSGPVNKLEDAFRILKPREVHKKKKKEAKVRRQGEWFFAEATPEELQLIKENLKFVERNRRITIAESDARGKPHMVDYLLRIGVKTFIKGKVRHADHKTREFFTWQQVFKNTERIDSGRVFGWID